MSDALLASGITAAACMQSSPSLRLRPGGEGDGEVEGEGLEAVTVRGIADGNQRRPHLPPPPSSPAPPPLSLSAPLSLVCCSQSTSRRPESEAVMRGEMMKETRREGGREGKMGNPAYGVIMLFAGIHSIYVHLGQAELNREDMGRMERQENRKKK